MADATEKLILLMEAQNRDVLRAFKQIETQSRKSFKQSARNTDAMSKSLASATKQASGFIGAIGKLTLGAAAVSSFAALRG